MERLAGSVIAKGIGRIGSEFGVMAEIGGKGVQRVWWRESILVTG